MMNSGSERARSDLISLTEGERGRLNAGDGLVPEGQKPQEAHLNSQRNPIKALAETTTWSQSRRREVLHTTTSRKEDLDLFALQILRLLRTTTTG